MKLDAHLDKITKRLDAHDDDGAQHIVVAFESAAHPGMFEIAPRGSGPLYAEADVRAHIPPCKHLIWVRFGAVH